MKRADESDPRAPARAGVESPATPNPEGKGAAPGAAAGQQAGAGGPRLSGSARHALTAILALVVAVNIFLSVRALQPKATADTSARVRAVGEGKSVPVYRSIKAKEPLHQLKAGDRVSLGDFRKLEGNRVPVHVHVDDLVMEGWIETQYIVPEDLERARKALEGL